MSTSMVSGRMGVPQCSWRVGRGEGGERGLGGEREERGERREGRGEEDRQVRCVSSENARRIAAMHCPKRILQLVFRRCTASQCSTMGMTLTPMHYVCPPIVLIVHYT